MNYLNKRYIVLWRGRHDGNVSEWWEVEDLNTGEVIASCPSYWATVAVMRLLAT